jgi:hypothetical protein
VERIDDMNGFVPMTRAGMIRKAAEECDDKAKDMRAPPRGEGLATAVSVYWVGARILHALAGISIQLDEVVEAAKHPQ